MSHLNNSTTPTGDYFAQRADMQPALNNNLFEEVLVATNLKHAWKQVRANKGAPGVDGLRIDDFLAWSKWHWKQCERQLRSGNYHPSPVRRVEIDKPDGGKRLFGIPTVLDRVIQQAITQVLSPIFEQLRRTPISLQINPFQLFF